MIDTQDLQTKTCKILNTTDNIVGTGIVVHESLVLTAYHVIEDFQDALFTVIDITANVITVRVADVCLQNDLAILKTEEHTFTNIVTLCKEEPVIGMEWATHGHPETQEGQSVGTRLNGTISNVIAATHTHDVVLAPGPIQVNRTFRGFSGSGLINQLNQVTSIMRFKDINDLCSVSIKKAEPFLKANGIPIQEDALQDFTQYLPEIFQTISGDFKNIGIGHATAVSKMTSPQTIADGLKGKLLFPEFAGGLAEIIGHLKRTTGLNKHIWMSWLEFLSYVLMLRGKFSDINAVYITIPKAEVSKLVTGVETKVNQDIGLTLQFFFTDEKEYFAIAQRYLIEHSIAGTLQNNHCHIFHSHTPFFGFQPFTKEDKEKIIVDIASPADAGLNIPASIDFGVLSFTQLSLKVAGSKTLAEATTNLIEIFTHAIS